jgi:hypothetical protein
VFAGFKKTRMSCYNFHFGLFIKLSNVVRRRPKLQGASWCSCSVDAVNVGILIDLSSGLNLFNFMEKD